MLAGLLFALGAALATGIASAIQAVAVRRDTQRVGVVRLDTDHVGEVGRLVMSRLYLAGTGLDILGFGCIVLALHWLPLFLVQCASASSVGVTALIGWQVLGVRLRREQVVALAGLGGGLVLLAAGARPQAASAQPHSTQWLLLLAAAPVALVALGLGRFERLGGVLVAVAGLAFAGTSIASRMLSDSHSVVDVVRAPATYALAIFGIVGMLAFAAGLQRTAVTTATATLFGVETIAASAVGLLVLGDATRHGFAFATAVGFVLTLVSVLVLALAEDAAPTRTTALEQRAVQAPPPA